MIIGQDVRDGHECDADRLGVLVHQPLDVARHCRGALVKDGIGRAMIAKQSAVSCLQGLSADKSRAIPICTISYIVHEEKTRAYTLLLPA